MKNHRQHVDLFSVICRVTSVRSGRKLLLLKLCHRHLSHFAYLHVVPILKCLILGVIFLLISVLLVGNDNDIQRSRGANLPTLCSCGGFGRKRNCVWWLYAHGLRGTWEFFRLWSSRVFKSTLEKTILFHFYINLDIAVIFWSMN